jgi:hypothetical protein
MTGRLQRYAPERAVFDLAQTRKLNYAKEARAVETGPTGGIRADG